MDNNLNCYEILIRMFLQDPATQAVKQCTVNPKKKGGKF